MDDQQVLRSATIGKLTDALVKAQLAMKAAPKSGYNPHFKSNFSTLKDCFDALREPLGTNGLAISQVIMPVDSMPYLITYLLHISGEWLASYLPIMAKDNSAQSFGSALSYSRRYGLQSITGLYNEEEDDDGNRASLQIPGQSPRPMIHTGPSQAQLGLLAVTAKQHKWTDAMIGNYLAKIGLKSVTELNYAQFNSLLDNVKRFPGTG